MEKPRIMQLKKNEFDKKKISQPEKQKENDELTFTLKPFDQWPVTMTESKLLSSSFSPLLLFPNYKSDSSPCQYYLYLWL